MLKIFKQKIDQTNIFEKTFFRTKNKKTSNISTKIVWSIFFEFFQNIFSKKYFSIFFSDQLFSMKNKKTFPSFFCVKGVNHFSRKNTARIAGKLAGFWSEFETPNPRGFPQTCQPLGPVWVTENSAAGRGTLGYMKRGETQTGLRGRIPRMVGGAFGF